jgi:hypothetical protein
MAIEINQVYKTLTGKFLQIVKLNESGFHNLIEVSDNVNKIPVKEKRNSFGHVTHRVDFKYSEETISTFKKMKAL